MISFNNILLRFGEKELFRGINWMIPDGAKVGLVGDNGTGKTTLFRLILKKQLFDSGTIEVAKKKKIGYLPQDLVEIEPLPLMEYLKKKCGILDLEERIKKYEHELSDYSESSSEHKKILNDYGNALESYNHMDGYSFNAKAGFILHGLGFKSGDEFKDSIEFSGGWKMRISLAVILLNKPDIMLLDEPTNHLDTESMEWLEGYLKSYKGTLITISHDRMFLNKMVTQIAELFRGKLTVYKGNYSYYLKEKELRLEQLKKELAGQQEEIKRTKAFIERFRYKDSKARQVQSRVKKLEKLEEIKIEDEGKKIKIVFPEHNRSGKEVVRIENLSKAYGDLEVLKDIDLTIYRGKKIALVGVNGAGKSTFSRLLSKSEDPTSGLVESGYNVKMSFFSQESTQNVNYENTIWNEVFTAGSKLNDNELRNFLGAFLFSGDDILKKISILSGGEKSRLGLLKILLKDSNLLILDEPTNHLDVKTKDIFQDALLQYSGTVIIVSHDRYFLDNLVTKVIEIRDKKFFEYTGNYSYFIEKRAKMAIENQVIENKEVNTVLHGKVNVKKSAKLRRELRSKIRLLEKEIANLEELKKSNDSLLCDPAIIKDIKRSRVLVRENRKTGKELKKMYKDWEQLESKLKELV